MPTVTVTVTLKPTLLDPQGRTVESALHSLGFGEVEGLRIGKVIQFGVAGGANPTELTSRVEAMCEKLLANPVTESYKVTIAP